MRPRNAILLAAAIVFVITAWVPFGRTLLYPLTLFTTWVHEMGHGLTGIAVGGRFEYLEIFRDASGLAYTREAPGTAAGLVALGGLLAPPIVGSAILAFVHGPRRARVLLTVLAVAIVLSLVLFVRSATGFIAMPIVAVALAWSAWRGFAEHPERRVIVSQALGVLLALDTLTRMVSYVFTPEVTVDGKTQGSDISHVADNLGGHYVLWGIAVTIFAVGLLAVGMWWAWRRPEPLSEAPRSRRRS
jgi:hypothetical protein